MRSSGAVRPTPLHQTPLTGLLTKKESTVPDSIQPQPSLLKKTIYPVRDSKSYISPYSQRDHSWNDAQHDQSDEVKWSGETNTTAPNSIDWVVNEEGVNGTRLYPTAAVLAQKNHLSSKR